MRPFSLPALFFTLAVPVIVFSQTENIRIGKRGDWIEPVAFNSKANPEDHERTSSYYLLIDEQENTIRREDYYHYVYKILTTEGIQDMSDLSFEFDPMFQELIFHEVKIIREGTVINRLNNNIRTVQREQSMDRYLYDGSHTAIINLTDVRVGDIIEYAFTRKGYNPVFEGNISRVIYFDYSVGYEKSYKRIILPTAKGHFIKFEGSEEVGYTKEKIDGGVSYTWSFERMKPVVYDNNFPGWYDPYRYVMLTNFKSWEEVSAWANKLFQVNDADQAQIKLKAESTFKETEREKYVMEVIRFVQDDIRYLGFETGLNSHKPHPPLKVFEQRFGDCKDKSLLLVTLLRAKGIEAYPVLVSTTLRDKITERLPAANIFNHCVVKMVMDGKSIFIDPTISNQGGSLDEIAFPNYRAGLIISPSTTAIENFPDLMVSTISEEQTFDLMAIGGEAMLTIRTTYTGSEADNQRGEFSRNNLQTVQKNYQDYYANLYSDITKWEDIKIHDNRNDNVFIVEEQYKIPSYWKPLDDNEGVIYAEVYPQTLESFFNVIKTAQRTAPYRLVYPVDYHHSIHINLPEEWNVEPEDEVIESDFYGYEYNVKTSDNTLSILTHYETKSDHIPPAYFEKFAADHQKMMNNLSYRLSYNTNIAKAADSKIPGLVVTILAIIGTVYAVFLLYNKYDPRPELPYLKGTPIGGWLILIGLGVALSPIRILIDLIRDTSLIDGSGWMTWLAAKQYGLFTFALFTHIYNIFNLLFTVLIAVLFFQRRSSFPRLMSIELAMTLIITAIDILLTRAVTDNPDGISSREVFRALGSAAIWIPYLNISTRVKETFVIRIGDEDGDNDGDLVLQPVERTELR